jgi:sugar-specific transcriptional regulator TrmB
MPTSVDQLQQLGLNKYEAEAYYTLLKRGPLTGYEVGKHSKVPLSRSYDILERLVERGLALAQPGEPARYRARDPQTFLGQVRASMEETLKELTVALTSFSSQDEANEFWIVRGQKNILERSRELIRVARSQLELSISAEWNGAFADEIRQASERGVHILQSVNQSARSSESILILRDGREALLGTLAPEETCQAVVSSNDALVLALSSYFENVHDLQFLPMPAATGPVQQDIEWMDWETRKHARLRTLSAHHRVA